LRGRAGDERPAGLSIVAADRKMIRYRSRRSPDTELRARLRELANHLTATGHRAPLHDGSARCPVAHIAPKGVSTAEANRHWMKVQWQDGRTVTLKYKDGEKKITVGPNTPIVTYVPGDKSDIKPGAPSTASDAGRLLGSPNRRAFAYFQSRQKSRNGLGESSVYRTVCRISR
jgi:hypothetical protein